MTRADKLYQVMLETYATVFAWGISHSDRSARELFKEQAEKLGEALSEFCKIYQIVSGERLAAPSTLSVQPKYSKAHLDSVAEQVYQFVRPSQEDCPEMASALTAFLSSIRLLQFGIHKTWK